MARTRARPHDPQPAKHPPASLRPQRRRRLLGNLLYAWLLFLVVLFLLAPFSLDGAQRLQDAPADHQAAAGSDLQPTLRNFQNVFGTQNFMRYIMNSLIIGAGCTLVGLLLGLPAAYSIARYQPEPPGRSRFSWRAWCPASPSWCRSSSSFAPWG